MPGVGWTIAAGSVVALLALALLLRGAWRRRRIRWRLHDEPADDPFATPADVSSGWLSQWLYLAGYRSPWAVRGFVGLSLVLFAAGLLFAALMWRLGVVNQFVNLLLLIPGGVGEVFLPLAYGSPGLSCVLLAALPTLVVRAARQRRVTQVEQDLPLTLDLLATLAQAGIGYDAAIERLLETIPPTRPLAREFRAYQVDMLAGRDRISSLRRLARRIETPWFSIFVSAVVQAEQMGSGLADVLQTQAEDLRHRRRERALAFAMTIQVKLLFPLVICFLPGIFVSAVGPAFYQIVQTLDALLAPYTGR